MSSAAIEKVKTFLSYRKQDWMLGQDRIESMQQDLQRLQRLAAGIEHFERKAATAFKDSQEPSILGFDHFYHKYEICRAAANRLRARFNMEANEIQL